MLILACLVSLVLAADPVDNGDVVAERTIRAPAAALYDALVDPRKAAQLAPDDCMRKWSFHESAQGEASFRVVYLMELFRRKLDVAVEKPDRPTRFEWNHLGNKGFVTRFSFKPVDDGTLVTLHSYIAEPPWPVQKYYLNKVKPRWEKCYEGFLAAVAESIE